MPHRDGSDRQLPAPSKRERTRARILDHAATLFTAHGVNGTSVDEIAASAGVSIGSVYQHFGSKSALGMAWVDEALDTVERAMNEARVHTVPLDRIYAAGDAYLEFAIAHPAVCRFLLQNALLPGADQQEAELRAAASRRVRQIVMGVATDLKQSTDASQAYPAPTDESIVILWGLWNGIVGLILRTDGTAIPPELARRSIERAREILRRATDHALRFPEPPPR